VCVDAWRDTTNCPIGMINILRRTKVFDFMFGPFNFENDEIDDAIVNYDDKSMALKLFGHNVYLDVDLLARA
jgi:hypothetical protein